MFCNLTGLSSLLNGSHEQHSLTESLKTLTALKISFEQKKIDPSWSEHSIFFLFSFTFAIKIPDPAINLGHSKWAERIMEENWRQSPKVLSGCFAKIEMKLDVYSHFAYRYKRVLDTVPGSCLLCCLSLCNGLHSVLLGWWVLRTECF